MKKAKKSSGTIPFYNNNNNNANAGTDMEKGFQAAKFDSHEYPFLIIDDYCSNPECDCNEAMIHFVEIEKNGKPKEDAIDFGLYLDLTTWQENRKPKRPKAIQCIVDEFINELPDEFKSRYKSNYKYVKEGAKSAIKFTAPIDEIRSGAMYSYNEVFSGSKSVLQGGQSAGFSFKYKGRSIFVEDVYCMEPTCKCNETILAFFELRRITRVLSDIFNCRFSFKSGLKIEDHPGCSKEEAKKIFNAWQKSDPDVIEILKHRYKQMKKVGQKLVDEAGGFKKPPKRTGPNGKIARNAPCPCGSGKKYKKCCGRK